MTFLNQALIFGAAAFLIPLIIHILNRNRFRTIDWGAMHLLESVIKVNHKRFRIDQLILLLVRCAIPILLAFCLARPVLTGSQALEGDQPVSLVLLLDTSYSMDTLEAGGSRFESAVTDAIQLIRAAPRGSDFAVVLTGGTPATLFEEPIYDSEAVIRKLKSQRAGLGASDMQSAMNEALAIASGMSQPRRELIVISDFQPADWKSTTAQLMEAIRLQVESMELPPALTLIPTGKSHDSNVSIDSLDFQERILGVGQRLDIRANIRNHGRESIETLRVVMKIDGVEEGIAQIAVAGKSSAQSFFPVEFQTSGSHVVEVEVMVDDALITDNRLSAAFSVWESLPVLLVDGDPRSEPLQSETDYLSVALTPFTFGRMKLADLIETKSVTTRTLTDELLQSAKVVVLANVDKLSDQQLNSITDFVAQGGAILICAGSKTDLKWSREVFYAAGKGLLPLPYLAVNQQTDSSENESRIVAQRYEHPALKYFNDASHGDLSTALFRRWYLLDESSDSTSQNSRTTDSSSTETASVIARLDTGDSLLVEKPFGDGLVVQFATTCDADWTDLPLQPIYVPLMQQLITHLAARNLPPQNIPTGTPALALLGRGQSPGTLSVETPEGFSQIAEVRTQGDLNYARFENTLRPGVYSMALPSNDSLHFVTTTSRNESVPGLIQFTDLQTLGESLGANAIESASEYLKQDRLRRNGREIWKSVLTVLLVLMFLELVLQQRFARVRV